MMETDPPRKPLLVVNLQRTLGCCGQFLRTTNPQTSFAYEHPFHMNMLVRGQAGKGFPEQFAQNPHLGAKAALDLKSWDWLGLPILLSMMTTANMHVNTHHITSACPHMWISKGGS